MSEAVSPPNRSWVQWGRTRDHGCSRTNVPLQSREYYHVQASRGTRAWTPPDAPKKSAGQAPGPLGGVRAAVKSPAWAGTCLSYS